MRHRQKSQHLSGEQQLANLVLRPRSDDMDKFPNDPLETAILMIASIGIAGGLISLWYLYEVARHAPS